MPTWIIDAEVAANMWFKKQPDDEDTKNVRVLVLHAQWRLHSCRRKQRIYNSLIRASSSSLYNKLHRFMIFLSKNNARSVLFPVGGGFGVLRVFMLSTFTLPFPSRI